jgi:chemosensory pili system protein ChpA (sensor histidine kinase/response regulator)
MPSGISVVAVINSSPDIVEMLRFYLQHEGFVVVTAHVADLRDGTVDLAAFVSVHHPDVMVYDVAPPYEANWQFLQHLRSNHAIRDIPVVLTSTHAQRARDLVGTSETIHDVIGKPYDLAEIAASVRSALGTPNARGR